MSTLEALRAELRKAERDLPNVGPLGRRDHIAYIAALERAIRKELSA